MKRIYQGGPVDGLTEDVGAAPTVVHEDALRRGVIGTVFPVRSKKLLCGAAPMRALYVVREVIFVNGILDGVLLVHIGWDCTEVAA